MLQDCVPVRMCASELNEKFAHVRLCARSPVRSFARREQYQTVAYRERCFYSIYPAWPCSTRVSTSKTDRTPELPERIDVQPVSERSFAGSGGEEGKEEE